MKETQAKPGPGPSVELKRYSTPLFSPFDPHEPVTVLLSGFLYNPSSEFSTNQHCRAQDPLSSVCQTFFVATCKLKLEHFEWFSNPVMAVGSTPAKSEASLRSDRLCDVLPLAR